MLSALKNWSAGSGFVLPGHQSRARRRTSAIVPGSSASPAAERWLRMLQQQRLASDCRGRQVSRTSDGESEGLVDVALAGSGDPKDPQQAFARLRWGGLFACIDPNPDRIRKILPQYDNANGFVLEQGFDELWHSPLGLRIPGVTPQAFYFTARKVQLIMPGEVTDRFTYDVSLQRDHTQFHSYCVCKQIPTVADIVHRLARRFPNLDPKDAQLRAEKLVGEVFPLVLTREAKVLETLQQKLPQELRSRVPQALRIKRNAAGWVTRLEMQWLRNGGQPLSQVTFARQAAELLAALHDQAGIMHLDLRLDNMVITENGVGFVDFGSAAQVGEKFAGSPVLNTLFTEMMRTSQVQRVLGQMLEKGQVTNEALVAVHGKVDRSVDAFYLAVQINRPHLNPELERLIDYNPLSETAKALEALTAAVLRPKHPHLAEFKSAADLLRGIRRIEQRFAA